MAYNAFEKSLTEAYVQNLYESYEENYFAPVRSAVPGFRRDQEIRLGILLENTNQAIEARMQNLYEDTQVSSVVDGIKTMYFDIITAVFPGLIAEELFSVQPIKQKTGQIFYLKYVYGRTKGRIKKGETVFAQDDMAGYENSNYTGEEVEDEVLFAADGATTEFSGAFAYIPMKPGTILIDLDGNEIKDDGNGALAGTNVTGTIDYATGTYKLTFTTAPAEGDAYADYEFDLSYAPATIPEIELKVTDTTVTARPRKLRGSYSLDAGYDLKMSQGIDIKDSLLEAAAMQLRHETDGDLLNQAIRQAAGLVTWNDTFSGQTTGISKRDFYEEFIDAIVRGSSMILTKTKRVEGNWVVVGKRGADVLSFIGAPRFVHSGNTEAGPHFFGTLDNKWKVYINPFFNEDDFLIGYKGSTLLDAGLIFAPYLLFFATEPVMLDDFLGRRGFASFYGKKMVNANMYVRGKIMRKANSSSVVEGGEVVTG